MIRKAGPAVPIAADLEDPTEFRKICDGARSHGRKSVDIWTLPFDKSSAADCFRRAGVGIWIAFEDGRSCSNEVLESD